MPENRTQIVFNIDPKKRKKLRQVLLANDKAVSPVLRAFVTKIIESPKESLDFIETL